MISKTFLTTTNGDLFIVHLGHYEQVPIEYFLSMPSLFQMQLGDAL